MVDLLKKHIEKITTPIFEKALQEAPINRLSLAKSTKIKDAYSLYSPHNYRLYFDFDKVNFHPLRPTKPTLESGGGRLVIFNSKEWKTPNKLKGCVLIVKKRQVQVNNLNEARRWYLIQMGSVEARKKQIEDIHQRKIQEAKKALQEFINIYGGASNFELKRIWLEEKILKDKPIDNLPLNMYFRTDNVKKAYNEANIEYFGDPIGAANYFSNRGVEDIAPEIAQQINAIGKGFIDFTNQVQPTIEALSYNIQKHLKVLKGIEKGINKFNSTVNKLNDKLDQKPLTKWL